MKNRYSQLAGYEDAHDEGDRRAIELLSRARSRTASSGNDPSSILARVTSQRQSPSTPTFKDHPAPTLALPWHGQSSGDRTPTPTPSTFLARIAASRAASSSGKDHYKEHSPRPGTGGTPGAMVPSFFKARPEPLARTGSEPLPRAEPVRVKPPAPQPESRSPRMDRGEAMLGRADRDRRLDSDNRSPRCATPQSYTPRSCSSEPPLPRTPEPPKLLSKMMTSRSDANLSPLGGRPTSTMISVRAGAKPADPYPPTPTTVRTTGYNSDDPDTPGHERGLLASAYTTGRSKGQAKAWLIFILTMLALALGITAIVKCKDDGKVGQYGAGAAAHPLPHVKPLRISTATYRQHTNKDKGLCASFLVLGGWGRRGSGVQESVAKTMAVVGMEKFIDFVISTGDNFLDSGLTSVHDRQFKESFLDVYKSPVLQVPWYAVLGNHDYGMTDENSDIDCPPEAVHGNETDCYFSPLHELDVKVNDVWGDTRWHCGRSYSLGVCDGEVEIFFMDTSPLIEEYRDTDWAWNRGGLWEQSGKSALKELEAGLSASNATWKLVVGHHPVLSNHRHFREVHDALEPILAAHQVQAYFSGHDHLLSHLRGEEHRPTQYITSGGGSRAAEGAGDGGGQFNSPFQKAVPGFVSVQIKEEEMVVDFFAEGNLETGVPQPLYQVSIPRVAMLV